MFSIGELSKQTKVKVPTIRFYEKIGLLAEADRTQGNQRRYDKTGMERLSFIRHARDLGFSIAAISSLIELQDHPDRSCKAATDIADSQLADVHAKIKRLKALEKELTRISKSCDGHGVSENCYVLASLADHNLCEQEH